MPQAELARMHLDSVKLQQLSPRQRYVYALLGHVFNELMVLQKLANIARPAQDATWYEKEAAVGTAIQVFKMLIGKVHEAMTILKKQRISEVLRTDYFPLTKGLAEKWDNTLLHHEGMTWIGKVRNSAAFHYMSEGQWAPHLTDDLCQEAHIIIGGTYGGTFYHWHDAVASYPMFASLNPAAPFQGFSDALDDIIQLTGDITEVLVHAVQAFSTAHLVANPSHDSETTFDAPDIEHYRIPVFFADSTES